MTNFSDVGKFHEKFGLDNTTFRDVGPREWDSELMNFRADFLKEELDEFTDAAADQDIAGVADALIDLVYVAMGTAHLLGLPWEALWTEVQRANMDKQRAAVDGSDSKRGSAFDVVKPEGWRSPDIAKILEWNGWSQMQMGC